MLRKQIARIIAAMVQVLPLSIGQTAFGQNQGQNQFALTGVVSSTAEANMEGVVVSAKKPGSIVQVSVTTDERGRYAFPANRLDPGEYTLSIRAVGFDIAAPTKATVVSSKASTADIKLQPTKDISRQLTGAEWTMSIPGTPDQKADLLNCYGCHTLERIMRSTHNSNDWTQVLTRMAGYGAVTHTYRPQRMLDVGRSGTPEQYRNLANYLTTINLSSTDRWAHDLKTLPRPKGRDTRAIVTEYDLGSLAIQPHDVVVDKEGIVWYTDFGQSLIGRFDPKSLKLTEFPIKKFKDKAPEGTLSLRFDHLGKLWFDTMYQGALASMDTKTGEVTYYPLPPEFNDVRVQLNFTGLRYDVDGKIWTKSVGTQHVFRLDVATRTWERFDPTSKLRGGGRAAIYEVISDSKNNVWMAEFADGHLGKIDAKTLEVTWYQVPTARARARRLDIDDKDRVLLTEYRGNKVALFDPQTEKFTEYDMPPYTAPYRATWDRNGEIWATTMSTDRVVRYNPKTGEATQYLMPGPTNMRSVFVDSSTTPVSLWVGANHEHKLVKVEPLD